MSEWLSPTAPLIADRLHGSMPNRSKKARKTVLIQMYNGKDKVEDDNKHPNEKLVFSGWNYHATRNSAGKPK